MADAETVTVTVEGPDGSDEVELPAQLIEMLAEDGESAADVVGDLVLMSCAQRIHAAVHHGEDGEDLSDVETVTMDLFEERFGTTFEEATGHSH